MAALLHRRQAQRAGSRTSTSTPRTSSPASTATWSASTSTSPAAPPASWPSASAASCRPTSASRAARCSTACARTATPCAELYEEREFGKALREVMLLADRVNEYVDQHKPWELAKQAGSERRAARRVQRLHRGLPPADHLPEAGAAGAGRAGRGLPAHRAAATGPTPRAPSARHRIGAYQHLMQRVDAEAARRAVRSRRAAPRPAPRQAARRWRAEIRIDDFAKVDLRIASIVDCRTRRGQRQAAAADAGRRRGPDAQRLLAASSRAYQPEDLVGKLTVLVANLAPRKMKFGLSEGMVLAASHADEKAHPGLSCARALAGRGARPARALIPRVQWS